VATNSNNLMVPSKPKLYFTVKHPTLVCKDITYFHPLMKQNKKQANFITSSVRFSENSPGRLQATR
jgi:hypothetical protein